MPKKKKKAAPKKRVKKPQRKARKSPLNRKHLSSNNRSNASKAEQDIMQTLDLQTKKLAVLLYASNMPDEVKQSWLCLLPKMTLEQIDRLINTLEAKFLDEMTKEMDEKHKTKLKKVFQKYDKLQEKNDQATIKKLIELRKSFAG